MATKTLILIPTETELEIVSRYIGNLDHLKIKLCGFGMLEAGLNTWREIQVSRPGSVLLCGVAGTLDSDACPIGETFCFDSVSQFGIGCERDTFQLAHELEFSSMPVIQDLHTVGRIPVAGQLNSVTGSGTFSTEQIFRTYPDARCEDMEGYGFATSANLNGIENVSIVRAVSNVVGDPFEEWSMTEALHHLGQTLRTHFEASA